MKSILEFTEKRAGYNCLMASLNPMFNNKISTGKNPTASTGMFSEIESTILYLIEEGEKHGVEMKSILDNRSKDGGTLFRYATVVSEKTALKLLTSMTTISVWQSIPKLAC